jgi:hypothetical protein
MFPMFQNLHSSAIKKYLFELLKNRYEKNERFIDRISSTITTKEDYEDLGRLMADVFEAGFMKAYNEYKDQLASMGLQVRIIAEEKQNKQAKKIFDQPEKSG